MTSGGETATLICPLNSDIIVMRNCTGEGLWLNIVDDGCTVNEQLEIINSSFTNVRNKVYYNKYNMGDASFTPSLLHPYITYYYYSNIPKAK